MHQGTEEGVIVIQADVRQQNAIFLWASSASLSFIAAHWQSVSVAGLSWSLTLHIQFQFSHFDVEAGGFEKGSVKWLVLHLPCRLRKKRRVGRIYESCWRTLKKKCFGVLFSKSRSPRCGSYHTAAEKKGNFPLKAAPSWILSRFPHRCENCRLFLISILLIALNMNWNSWMFHRLAGRTLWQNQYYPTSGWHERSFERRWCDCDTQVASKQPLPGLHPHYACSDSSHVDFLVCDWFMLSPLKVPVEI